MIADIIPCQKMPRALSLLSYQIPQEYEDVIKIGQIWEIPLRQSTTRGIVADIKKNARHGLKLKWLKKIINKKTIFTEQQLKLFINLGDYYGVSASLFIHCNLPKIIKNEWDQFLEPQKPIDRPEQKKENIEYFWWGERKQKLSHYQKNIHRYSKLGQVLIVVPQISDIENIVSTLKIYPEDLCVINSQISRSAQIKAWQSALNGNKKIFIGTRLSCFLPFTNLQLIIVDDEHAPDHKQYDMAPRYAVKKVCQLISSEQKTKIIFLSPSPSIENYYEFSPHYHSIKNTEPDIINLENELKNKNYTFVSDRLKKEIQTTIDSGKKTFLFVNKKGESNHNYCTDCGHTFNCPSCLLSLIKTKESKLACYYCHYEEDFPPFCPKCHGPNFRSLGLGIEKIAKNIKKILPETTISYLTKESPDKTINNAQIIVGTKFATNKINWPQIGLIGVINADQLWQHSEFMAKERAYQTLINILTRAPKNAKIIIQTFSPENTIIRSIQKNKPAIFYQEELTYRKKFFYPPFSRLIKISTQNKNEKPALDQAKKIYENLQKIKGAEISTPLSIGRHILRGRYKFNIIIKLKDISILPTIFKVLPNDCLIDVDPQTLLN
ncbi:primosomal protein N' [Candidatus Kuenenbacteria bacterium]|nr:primosomal protein N' [Candidatus Kuenenbacteria bacterium]